MEPSSFSTTIRISELAVARDPAKRLFGSIAYVQHYDSDEVDVRLHVDRSVKYDQIGRVLASLQSSRIVRVGFANSKPGT